jgi:hypothetical protein
MRILKISQVWITAFVLAVGMAGCNDPDASKGGPPPSLTPPTVVSVVPVGGATGICQGAIVTATFSKAMNPATIIQSPETTFTLTAGGASVSGTVSLDSTDTIATFTPTNPLVVSTQYTATITTAAKDQFGNALAQPFVWMFTTATTACPGPITLGTPGCGFGILAGSTVTNTGATHVTGDVGVWAGSAVTGFPPGTLTGNGGVPHTGDAVAMTAQGQLTTAYNNAGTAAGGTFGLGAGNGTVLPADIGALPQNFPPGVYRTTSAQPSLGITGDLTLDPLGDPNAVWIFQIGSTLITAGGKVNVLPPGQPKNVNWQIGSSATLGAGTTMAGNLMALASITFNAGATLNGRALARNGAVTLDNNPVNVPPCP